MVRGDLTDVEYADYCDLDDRACRGEHLSHDDSNRLTGYQLRIAPPPTPEWERAHYAKLRAQGIDFEAGYAAINRGDTEAAEQHLASIATPPRSEIAYLERRINTALQRAAKRPRSIPVRTGIERDRGRPRRRVRRTVRLAAHGPPGRPPRPDDDDPHDDVVLRAAAA